MSAPLGVGVIGLGVGEQHARAFAAHPDCRLHAICDFDAAKLEAVAARLPDARRYQNADELIDDPEVRVVSIASNDDHHAAQILRALRLGKHVFCEKPLCLAESELHDIVGAWRRTDGARLSTNTVLRRAPRYRWAHRAIREGRLGREFCIEADYVYGRLHKLTSSWRGRIPGYSVMLGGGIHMIDLVLWLTGERPVEVFAHSSRLGSTGTGFDGTDLVLAQLRFESGLLARVGANFASVYAHHHRLVVHGTTATFESLPLAVSASARLWTERDGGAPPSPVDETPKVAKGELIPAYVAALMGRGEPDVSEREAFAAVSLCLAVEKSLATGKPVSVDYLEN
jgi:predicted dehydrogenase